jgi:hypothetical protein
MVVFHSFDKHAQMNNVVRHGYENAIYGILFLALFITVIFYVRRYGKRLEK